jgi:hypothetical protein
MILCLRPLPAVNGGWNSAKWRTPKLAAAVATRPAEVTAWLAARSAEERSELRPILTAPFVAGLRMEGPATTFDLALAYAEVVAEACAAVVVLGSEIISDRRASVEVWSGNEIEARWRVIDAEAARAEPGYQPVRDAADDHRATQTFTLPIRLPGVIPDAPPPALGDDAELRAALDHEPTQDGPRPTGEDGDGEATTRPYAAQTPEPAPDPDALDDEPRAASASDERRTDRAFHVVQVDGAGSAAAADDGAAPAPLGPTGEDDWSDVMPE